MHGVELATRVPDALRAVSRVLEVDPRVCELDGPRAFRLRLRKLGGDEFKSTKFNIPIPLAISCRCGYSGSAKSANRLPEPELGIACPKCGGHGISLTTGREIELVEVKLEEVG